MFFRMVVTWRPKKCMHVRSPIMVGYCSVLVFEQSQRTCIMTCNYWQDYLWLFTGEDLNFGHMFGSCIKTVPLLRTCPLPSFKNDNEMAVSRFGLVLLLAVSRTEDGFEGPQNFRHCQHSRTCSEEHSWREVSGMFWTVDHWLTKYTAVEGNCFKSDSNNYSLLLLYLIVMRLWAW